VILATARPYSPQQLQAALEKRGLKAQQFQGRKYFGPARGSGETVCPCNDRIVVFSRREEWLREWIDRIPTRDAPGPLRPALDEAAAGRHHLVVGVVPVASVRDQLVRHLQQPFRGLRPEHRLTQPDPRPLAEVRTVTLTANLKSRADGATTDTLEADLRVTYPSSTAGARGHKALVALRDFLAGVFKLQASGADLEGGPPPVIAQELALALRSARLEQVVTEGRVALKVEWSPAWVPAVVAARKQNHERADAARKQNEARRKQWHAQGTSENNLKSIALAMYNYHRGHKHLPPAALTDKAGKKLLSWRVLILPELAFVEGQPDLKDKLYKQFKLDEPWDSHHNLKLLDKMPKVYAPPLVPAGWKPGTTYYQVFTGEQTLFPDGRQTRLEDFDGTAKTLLVVEAFQAVPWTKPVDLPWGPDQPLPMLGGIFQDGFQAAFVNGAATQYFPRKFPPEQLRALILPRLKAKKDRR
jgi:hypothetical protein